MDSQAERIQARATAKLCIAAPWSSASTGTVVEIANGRVRLDRTVAYPESGGQEGDRGVLIGAAGVKVPFVELHLSNIFAREPERRQSVIADLAVGLVTGFGAQSYVLALQALLGRLRGG